MFQCSILQVSASKELVVVGESFFFCLFVKPPSKNERVFHYSGIMLQPKGVDVETSIPGLIDLHHRGSFRKSTGRVNYIKGIVFRTGAPYTGDCFQDGCTPKLTGARAPGAPVLTETLIDIIFQEDGKVTVGESNFISGEIFT